MNTQISQASMIRGADGRLYSLSVNGTVEAVETASGRGHSTLRAGDRSTFDTTDYESGRMYITPGA